MSFQFATCERSRAKEFIQSVYPSYLVVDSGKTKEFLDVLEEDIVRVTDPSVHGRATIVSGKNWNEDRDRDRVSQLSQDMHYEILNTLKDKESE